MKEPTKAHMKKYNKRFGCRHIFTTSAVFISIRNLAVVPVVVDPILSRKMRPHQKEGTCLFCSRPAIYVKYTTSTGVMFMYESVMGLRKHEGQGCILADEMSVFLFHYESHLSIPRRGLGKTLQVGYYVKQC